MKTIKSKLLFVITFVIMAVCLSVGLAACGGKKAFSAPENVKVTGNVLSWDAVDGAEGYTVKINTNETTSVKAESLDLTTVIAKLVSGENTLSVKANETEKKTESVYSQTVKYIYTPSAVTPSEFATPTGLKIEEGILSWNAVSGAAVYIVTCGNESKEVTTTSINLAIFKLDEGATVTFSVKVKATATINESPEAVSPEYTVPNITEEAKLAIAAAKAELPDDDEGIIAAVNAFELLYEEYPASVRENTEVAAAFAELTEARTTAQNNIKTAVDTLSNEVDALLAKDEYTAEDYDALGDKLTDIAELGAYAKSYYTGYAEKSAAITAKREEIENTPAHTEDSVEVFVNGATGTATILYKAVNVLGNPVTGTAPALTVEIEDGTTNGVDTSAAAFTLKNGTYYYTVNFTKIDNINKTEENPDGEAPEYRLKVTYTIDGGEEQTATFIEFHDDIYFNPGNNFNAITAEGKIQFSGAEGLEAYFDIYEASTITRGTSVPVITGFPLIKGLVVKNGMTVEELRKQLARHEVYGAMLLGETYEVRFVVYNKSVNGISNIKTDLVSADTYTLDLTEEDAKERINLGNAGTVIGTDGGVTIGAAFDNNALAAQFGDEAVTVDNIHEFLAYNVYVTLDGETKSFTIDCPQGGSISSSVMQTEIFKLFKNTTESDYKIGLQLALRESALKEYGDILRESVIREYDWNVRLTLPDNTCQIRFAGTDFFEILRAGSSNGSVFNFGVESVEVKVEKDGVSYSVYLFKEETPKNNSYVLNMYANADKTNNSGNALDCDTVSNGWCNITGFNDFIMTNYSLSEFNVQEGWKVSTKVHFDGDYGLTSEYSAPITYVAA